MYYSNNDNKYNGQLWENSFCAEKGSVKLKNRLFSILSVVMVLVLALSIFGTVAVLAADDANESANTLETQSEPANTNKDSIVDTDAVNNMNLSEKFVFGLKVMATGMLMVFAVLILLWVVIAIMARVFGSKTFANKEEKPKAVSAPVTSKTAEADESEIVAVATAAIAASRGESKCAFKVVSIQKIER